MRIERVFDVEAPPETVWAVMRDVVRWHEWTASITRIDLLDGEALGPGARARVRQPGFPPAVWRVTEFDPPRGFVWESRTIGSRAVGIHRVAAHGGGARATLAVELDGWMVRLLGRWVARVSERFVEMEAQGLKRRCEAAPVSAPTASPPAARPGRG